MKRPKFPAIFRWKYVLPRAAIVAAVVAAVHWGLDPLLKYAIVASGEAALGAKVDVAELSTSLLDGQIRIDGFAAANPHKPMRNLAGAEHMQLNVDFNALLHKRLVVTGGVIRGIEFDAERTSSGALEKAPEDADAGPSMFDPLTAAAGDAAVDWFHGLEGRFEDDLESKLATPRVLKELEDRWKTQYAALKSRADQLRTERQTNRTGGSRGEEKPFAPRRSSRRSSSGSGLFRRSLSQRLRSWNRCRRKPQADRKAIDAARNQDELLLREAINVAKTDGGKLTEYLLGDVAHGYLAQTIGWVEYIRSWVPKTKMARPARAHGTNVLFVDRRRPQFLIERITLSWRGPRGRPAAGGHRVAYRRDDRTRAARAADATPFGGGRGNEGRPAGDDRPPPRQGSRHAGTRLFRTSHSASARSARPTDWR